MKQHIRGICFLLLSLIGLIFFYAPLQELALFSFKSELYSHFLLIPLISIYFFIVNRKAIFADINYAWQTGVAAAAVGMLFYLLGSSRILRLNQNDQLALMMFSALIWFNGSFILVYGMQSFRNAMFPLLFLIFMIPIPTPLLEPLIRSLQVGSVIATDLIFRISGIPFYREGMVFNLPGMSIEVAEQCSGIRAALALLITSIIAGYVFLQTERRRIVLALCVFPIAVFKNALRIATISLLAVYADKTFLTNSLLHKAGGKPFFILALIFLWPVVWILRKSEKKQSELDYTQRHNKSRIGPLNR